MNFQITQGTGTTIGTDAVAGVNYQEIKLIDATIGSATGTGIAANPLKVSLEFTNSNTAPLLINGTVNPTLPFDRAGSGIIAAPADTFVFDCTGVSTLGWTTSGNWIGTMTHEVQYGDGQWFTVETIDTNLANDGKPFVVTQWTEGLNNDPWITNVAGATQIRFRYISYTSGSATITVNGSIGVNAVRIYNLTASILQTTARLNDGTGNALTSTTIGPKQALDVNIAGGVTIDVNLDHTTDNVLVYGNDGTTDRKILTDATGAVETVITNFPATTAVTQSTSPWVVSLASTTITGTVAVTQSGVWSIGRTWTLASGTDSVSAVQSGTWNINNISGTISLPTGAATEATLSTRLADATFTTRINTLGQKTSANSTPVVLASDQSVIPVSQSGVWSIGRTWTLSSGSDSISAVQSGTWNINNISGTISLPTGAATEATLSTRLADATFTARVNTLGQKTMANSTPVVLASDQTVIPVSQSGVWSTGRTWTLASGSDSISAVQSGTWTVQPGNTPNTSPWLMTINQGGNSATVTASNALKIDGSAVTQPISAVSLPLPTGASTSANQTNGTQKSQVVDGANVTVGPAQAISGTNYLPVVQASSGTTGTAVPARTTQVGGSDGTNLRTLATDTNGQLKVDLYDGSGNAVTSTVVSTTRSVDTNITQGPDGYAAQQNQVFTTSFAFNLPTGGTETPALFLKNPNASGKTLIIKRILISGISTANNEAVVNIYSNPTTSANGTAQSATTMSIGSGATAVATPFSGPTASANGARLISWQVPAAGNNTPAAPALAVDGLIRIAANNTLLITGIPAANNMNVAWTVIWQEI